MKYKTVKEKNLVNLNTNIYLSSVYSKRIQLGVDEGSVVQDLVGNIAACSIWQKKRIENQHIRLSGNDESDIYLEYKKCAAVDL